MQYPLPETNRHKDTPIKGIMFATIAFFLLAVMNLLAKILNQDYGHHVVEIAFYRNLISVIPFLTYILITQKYDLFKTKTPKALVARSIIGTLSLITTFAAFTMLPMAEVTVLLFTTTLMTPALAYFILKERVGIHRWSAIAIGFLGVIIMVGLQGFSGTLIGITLALIAATMHASLGLLLRFMKQESSITVTFYFVLTGMIITGVMMPFFASTPSTIALIYLVATGIAGGLAQLCLSLAFKNAPAAAVAPLNYTGLIWATGFDIMIWHIIPGWPVFLGAGIIIISNCYIIYREHTHNKKAAAT